MDSRPREDDKGFVDMDVKGAEKEHGQHGAVDDPDTTQLEQVFRSGSLAPEWDQVRADAIKAEGTEAAMGLLEGLKTYPRAVFWSFSISLLIIMEGYDTAMLFGVLGLEQYREKFGVPVLKDDGTLDHQLLPAWQVATTQAPNIGCIIGIFLSSYAQDRWGYRRTLQIALVFLTGTIFIVFFAVNVEMLFVGILLCGLPWGAFSTSAVSYASDVTPVPLRGYLTTYINLCWVIGQMLSAGILVGVFKIPGDLAYQVAFAIQWFWPIPLFILITLAPESPWFLVRKGRLAEAKHAVTRLQGKKETVNADDTVAMMIRTNQIEMNNEVGSSYLDCFKGVDLRRTEISCFTWACQILCGTAVAGSPVYFFQQAGLAASDTLHMNLGVASMAIVGTLMSWISLTYGGRRPFFCGGMAAMCVILIIIGGLAWKADSDPKVKWGQAALFMVFAWAYDFTVGPLTYCIVAIASGVLNTYMMNPLAWNWRTRSALFWAGTCLLMTIWSYFRLPEMKGRSFRELDVLFERRIPARKFKETVVGEEDEA